MSFLAQSKMVEDIYLLQRIAACLASKKIEDPEQKAFDKRWNFSAYAGWSSAYADAIEYLKEGDIELAASQTEHSTESDPQDQKILNSYNTLPGELEDYITDTMILEAVEDIFNIS